MTHNTFIIYKQKGLFTFIKRLHVLFRRNKIVFESAPLFGLLWHLLTLVIIFTIAELRIRTVNDIIVHMQILAPISQPAFSSLEFVADFLLGFGLVVNCRHLDMLFQNRLFVGFRFLVRVREDGAWDVAGFVVQHFQSGC